MQVEKFSIICNIIKFENQTLLSSWYHKNYSYYFCVTILRELSHSSVYVLCVEYLRFKRDRCVLPGPPIFWPKVFAFFQVMQSRELVFVDST